MTLDDYIANYLRDAQGKIALLSVEMNELEDQGSYQYRELYRSRLELSLFMSILYEGKWLIQDGYNHMKIGESTTWTEREVISEIEWLRYHHHMNEMPYITFTAHYPRIASTINGGGGAGSVPLFPTGAYGKLMGFTAAGEAEPQDISPWAGHIDGESISTYFSR
jgi:hypothetical protein